MGNGWWRPRSLCEYLALAFLHARGGLFADVRRLHRQDHELARVEGDLPGLLPPQAHDPLAEPLGQGGAHGPQSLEDLPEVSATDQLVVVVKSRVTGHAGDWANFLRCTH